MRKEHFMRTIVFILALAVFILPNGTSFGALTIKANHDHIKVDYNYHGSTVSVSGESDPGVDIVVTLRSGDIEQTLKQKSKVGGVLWMNTGEVEFDHVPNFYYLRSSKPIEDILNPEERTGNLIGYEALLGHSDIKATSDETGTVELFADFVKYKEANRLYSFSSGDITLKDKGEGQEYYTMIQWPFQAPPGDYIVTVYAVKDGKVLEKAESNVQVERTGIVKSLTGMAWNNAVLYGIVAILVALAAGFGVGLVFGKGGGAH